jgi:hypothetical protein
VIEADESIAEMSRPRVHIQSFTTVSSAPTLLSVRRVPGLVGQHVEGPLGSCTVELNGEVMQVDVADGPFLGELVLRLAYYIVTTRLGGLLIHATGLEHSGQGVVASGKSGDGKSTLSRLARGAGVRLLSDEIIQLFPDGHIGGTPFRSDLDNVGTPGLTRATYFLTLKKAEHEALEALSALEAGSVALAQCFEVDSYALSRLEVRRRMLSFLSNVELRTLAFRKHADAGAFIRGCLGA